MGDEQLPVEQIAAHCAQFARCATAPLSESSHLMHALGVAPMPSAAELMRTAFLDVHADGCSCAGGDGCAWPADEGHYAVRAARARAGRSSHLIRGMVWPRGCLSWADSLW